ncbi:hypothetical protein ACEPAH_6271 [Sanghuangporus vaninii]
MDGLASTVGRPTGPPGTVSQLWSLVGTAMDPSRPSGSSSLVHPAVDPPAGIYCANPDCRTRAGERSRGHQSCRALLCGHCCQNAALAAAEAGEQRPICKVHARRVHTGHKPAPKTEHRPEESSIPNTTGTGISTSSPAGPRLGESEELHDLLEKRARLEQSLKRSLTMVIWYRNGCDPLRIAHEVSTFPLFQLQDFPELIGELGLQPSSYIDAYNTETGQWEQHKISTVRSVEQDQRLLYRLRPSLLDSLTDCPFLEQELSLQHAPKSNLTKRHPSAPLASSPPGKQVRVLSNPTPVRAPTTTSPQNTTLQNWDSPMSGVSTKQGPTAWSYTAPAGTALPGVRHSPSTVIPAATSSVDHSNSVTNNSGSIKRWPTDYTVHEIVEGFDTMAEIMKSDPSARQRNAFERVFPPCRYVKSTVGRAKLYWKRASEEIRSHFLALPRDDPRGKWTHFVHLMDGRLVIEVGKEKLGGVSAGSHGVPRIGIGPGTVAESMVDAEHSMDTAEEDDHADTTSPLSFTQTQSASNQPQIAIQSPPTMTAHPSLSLRRSGHAHTGQPQAPPMGALLPNPNPLTHHASAPAMPMTTTFTLDRSINMNRSSSSLSGAITIPEV